MGGDRESLKAAARAAVRDAVADAGVECEQPDEGTFVVKLPGEHKLWTTCSLVVGDHTLSLNAFVARRPDENHEGVYRWLLERNTRLGSLAFALDRLGDVYLVGRLPLGLITAETVDQLLELGFASAIRREWEWRTSRGESLANLAAFRHLIERTPDTRDESGPTPPK